MFVTAANAQAVAPDAVHTTPGSDAAHGAVVGIEGESAGHFPPMATEFFPSQLLWLAITFGLFYLVLQKVILPRIGGILENRRDRIAQDLDAARSMKADADESLAAYEQELAAARDRSHKIAVEARAGAKADADAERSKIEAELDLKLEAAQARIADIKRTALADVGAIAEDAAASILVAIAGLEISRDEVAGAVRAVRS